MLSQASDTEIHIMKPMTVHDIGANKHITTEFAVITLYLTETLSTKPVVNLIIRELHIVKDFKVKMLVRTDILKLEQIDIMFSRQMIILRVYASIKILISTERHSRINVYHSIQTLHIIIILAKS